MNGQSQVTSQMQKFEVMCSVKIKNVPQSRTTSNTVKRRALLRIVNAFVGMGGELFSVIEQNILKILKIKITSITLQYCLKHLKVHCNCMKSHCVRPNKSRLCLASLLPSFQGLPPFFFFPLFSYLVEIIHLNNIRKKEKQLFQPSVFSYKMCQLAIYK